MSLTAVVSTHNDIAAGTWAPPAAQSTRLRAQQHPLQLHTHTHPPPPPHRLTEARSGWCLVSAGFDCDCCPGRQSAAMAQAGSAYNLHERHKKNHVKIGASSPYRSLWSSLTTSHWGLLRVLAQGTGWKSGR